MNAFASRRIRFSPASSQPVEPGQGQPDRAEVLEFRVLWARARADLQRSLDSEEFDSWIAPLLVAVGANGQPLLRATSEFERDRIRDNYLDAINTHWRSHDPKCRRIGVEAVEERLRTSPRTGRAEGVSPVPADELGHKGFDFQGLVRGASNETAIGVAHRLADGCETRPLSLVLFHGPNGVGKTHVLNAIARKRRTVSGLACSVWSAEEFVYAYVEGVKRGSTREMRERIRKSGTFLLDDVHLLKPGSLRECFAHLRAILAGGGQVILTSDTPPESMQAVDPRMRDELMGGVRVPIGRPDAAMRCEIARIKWSLITADYPGFKPEDEWFRLLAEKLPASGRAVAGAVGSIFAATALIGLPVTIRAVMASIRQEKSGRRPRVDAIKEVIAESFGVTRSDMESADRRRAVSRPRQIAMYISRKLTRCSYPQIGRLFGGKDHTTVMYACDRIARLIDKDPALAEEVRRLEERCCEVGTSSG